MAVGQAQVLMMKSYQSPQQPETDRAREPVAQEETAPREFLRPVGSARPGGRRQNHYTVTDLRTGRTSAYPRRW